MVTKDDMITEQQEIAFDDYLIHTKEQKNIGCEPFSFREFYGIWCQEEGYYNDIASFQNKL